jgi:hypothetical protein
MLQMQAMQSSISRILPPVALLRRCETTAHQDVPQWYGTARH